MLYWSLISDLERFFWVKTCVCLFLLLRVKTCDTVTEWKSQKVAANVIHCIHYMFVVFLHFTCLEVLELWEACLHWNLFQLSLLIYELFMLFLVILIYWSRIASLIQCISDTFSIEKMKSLPLVHAEDINKSWLALSQLKPTDLEASWLVEQPHAIGHLTMC